MTSVRARGRQGPPPDDLRNPTVDFPGERRRNDTHQSTTDPQARLYRKGSGREATLAYLESDGPAGSFGCRPARAGANPRARASADGRRPGGFISGTAALGMLGAGYVGGTHSIFAALR